MLYFHQITSLAADITGRDFSGRNSSPEPVKEEEPLSLFDSFKETVTESFRDDEPQGTYAAERSNSPHESEIEDIPIEDTIKEKVADVLGDNGVPLGDPVDDKEDKSDDDRQDSSDDGMQSSGLNLSCFYLMSIMTCQYMGCSEPSEYEESHFLWCLSLTHQGVF